MVSVVTDDTKDEAKVQMLRVDMPMGSERGAIARILIRQSWQQHMMVSVRKPCCEGGNPLRDDGVYRTQA